MTRIRYHNPFAAWIFLVHVLLYFSYTVHAWTFTAVLPSPGNPKNKLNQRVSADLEQKEACSKLEQISNGKVQFDWKPCETTDTDLAQWLGRKGFRSLRVLVWEAQIAGNSEDTAAFTKGITTQVLDGIEANLSNSLEAWQALGNKAEIPYTVYVSCQKLHSDHAIPSFWETLSTTQIATQIVLGCERFHWSPQPKKQKADLRLHILLQPKSTTGLSVRVELITLQVPPNQRANQELPYPGMKRVESWAVAKSAQIQPRHTVLDPMCGKATFLLEAATFFPCRKLVGVDSDPQQLALARINRQALGLDDCIELVQGDARNFDLPDHSVDRVLCCPPFGRQFLRDEFEEQQGSLLNFYQQLMREWKRILKEDGKMVLLIDAGNLEDLLKALREEFDPHCISCLRRFRLGKLQGVLVVAELDRASTIPSQRLPWENENQKKTTRAMWTQLRALELPSLVPVSTRGKG